MIDHAPEVLVENVEEVSLLSHIKQELVVLQVVVLDGLRRVKVLLNLVDAVLECAEGLVAHLTKVERVKVRLLGLETKQFFRQGWL